MAEEHNAIKYGSTISRAGAIAVGGAYGDVGISRLSESLVPSINLWQRPDWALLRGEIDFARFVSPAVVAGRFATTEIVNPNAGSKIATVYVNLQGASDAVDFVIDNGPAIAANQVTNRGVAVDGRFPNLGEVSQCTIVTGDAAAGTVLPQYRWRNAALGQIMPHWLAWVLPPGRKIFIASGAVAQTFSLNVFIRERTPFPSELQARG